MKDWSVLCLIPLSELLELVRGRSPVVWFALIIGAVALRFVFLLLLLIVALIGSRPKDRAAVVRAVAELVHPWRSRRSGSASTPPESPVT